MNVDLNQIEALHQKALEAAQIATRDYINSNGEGAMCGFAWVTIYDIKLNTKVGKKFAQMGFEKSYHKGIELWNPSKHHTQSVDAKEAGANAYATVLSQAGFKAYSGSRLD